MIRWLVSLGAVALVAAPAEGLGQSAPGQTVLLQLRPRSGDTLRLRVDQTIEMGRTRSPVGDAEAMPNVASVVLRARIAVEASDDASVTVWALTDSVRVAGSSAMLATPTLRAARALQGRRFRFHVDADGRTRLAEPGGMLDPAAGGIFSQLPATLPREPLAPGATWNRAVEIPLIASLDGRGAATLNAGFRFDSLSRSAELAYVSVKGRLVRGRALPGSSGSHMQTSGDVTGTLVIDLRRGWIADARSVVNLHTLMSGSPREPGATRVRIRMTQWMKLE